jgi:3-oxoacyl-[acyl-carrier protein] reductase
MEVARMQAEQMVAIVTGGGRGIGAAATKSLASAGTAVALVARSREETGQVAAAIEASGGSTLPLAADVSEDGAAAEVTQAAQRTLAGRARFWSTPPG